MNTKKGSVTVELAIIFPVIIYILFLLIYIVILMYQQAYVKNVCEDTITKAGNWWMNAYKDFETGKIQLDNISCENVYANLYDMDEDSKKQILKKYIYNGLNSGTILKPSKFDIDNDINIEVANSIIFKRLYLNASITYKLPVPKLVRLFKLQDDYTFEVTSSTLVKDYAGYINDINFMFYAYDRAKEDNVFIKKIDEAITSIKKKVLY